MGGMGGGAERFAAAGIAAAMPALAAGVAASLAPPVAAMALFALAAGNLYLERGALQPLAGLALLAFPAAAALVGAHPAGSLLGAALILTLAVFEACAAQRTAQTLGRVEGAWPAAGFFISAAIGVLWLAARAPSQIAGLPAPAINAPGWLAAVAGAVWLGQIAVFTAQRVTARRLGERLTPRTLFADAWTLLLPPLLALPADPAAGFAALGAWRLAMRLSGPAQNPARALA